MTQYTVTATREAENDLARLWLSAPDRRAISNAADTIDRTLRFDPQIKGCDAGRGLRQLIVPPPVAEFSVEEDDRTVSILSMRHMGELTNGH
jgi:hypothetical protein